MELINRKFYDAICHFEDDEESQEYYYETLYSKTGKVLPDGSEEILRDQILRVYAALFCDDMNLPMGAIAGFDEVDATADRLYIGSVGFDPEHWYFKKSVVAVVFELVTTISDLETIDWKSCSWGIRSAREKAGQRARSKVPNIICLLRYMLDIVKSGAKVLLFDEIYKSACRKIDVNYQKYTFYTYYICVYAGKEVLLP